MKCYNFDIKIHEEFGTLGFVPSWYPNGDPLEGMAVAHDILEHFPKDTGDPEGEYLALGASIFIRDGQLENGNSAARNMSSDLERTWEYLIYRDKRSYVKPCEASADSDLMDTAREAVGYWMKEEAYTNRTESEKPDSIACERVACWIARGFERARKRYRNASGDMIFWDLFKPIQEEADKLLKHASEGMGLTVRVDYKNRKSFVRLRYNLEEN